MNTLFTAFIIQTVLCAALFVLILYLVLRTSRLKEEIKPETEKIQSQAGDS